jgi:hypothetical protein
VKICSSQNQCASDPARHADAFDNAKNSATALHIIGHAVMGHAPDEPFNDCAEEPTSKKNGQGKGRNNSDNKDRESQKSKPGTESRFEINVRRW